MQFLECKTFTISRKSITQQFDAAYLKFINVQPDAKMHLFMTYFLANVFCI